MRCAGLGVIFEGLFVRPGIGKTLFLPCTTMLFPEQAPLLLNACVLLHLWTAYSQARPGLHPCFAPSSAQPPLPRPLLLHKLFFLPVLLHLCLFMGPAGCALLMCQGLHAIRGHREHFSLGTSCLRFSTPALQPPLFLKPCQAVPHV